ncbi:MAG TPA: triple tyrosine motif-containing protein [Chitinophagaceae bacterium]|nr:triple tyrosine motif-containing protein [Chitinophagaceae bacterium]
MGYLPVRLLLAIAFVCVAGCNTILQSQTTNDARFAVQRFNDENSILQNSVTGMAFDADHYLWISTQYGVFRFDGRNFMAITTSNNATLKYNRIISLAADFNKNIFFTDEHWNFYKVIDCQTIQLIPDETATGFMLHCSGSPVFWFAPKQPLANAAALRKTLHINGNGISRIMPVDASSAYITFVDDEDHGKMVYLRNGEIIPLPYPYASNTERALVVNNRVYLLQNSGKVAAVNGALVANTGQLVFHDNGEAGNTAPPTAMPDISEAKFFFNSMASFMLNGNLLYIITAEKGNLVATPVVQHFPEQGVREIIFGGPENAFFAGTNTAGLLILRKKQFTPLLDSARPEANNFYAQLEINKGSILTNYFTVFKGQQLTRYPIAPAERLGMWKDRKGNIWYQRKDSLYRTDETLQKEKFIQKLKGPIHTYFEKEGKIWFGNLDMLGYIESDSLHMVADVRKFDGSFLQCIDASANDHLLIGTQEGLYNYWPANGKLQKISKEKMYVRNILTTDDGLSWISTYGQGIFCLSRQDLFKLPIDKNGFLLTAHCFLEDKAGFFWISTNKGLFKVKRQDLANCRSSPSPTVYYHYFDKADGFETNEFNGGCSPCGLRLANGNFSFPSLNGLILFNPLAVNAILPQAKLHIDFLKTDSLLINQKEQITLRPQFNQLLIQCTTPYFGHVNNLSVEYKLEGLSEAWNQLPSSGLITYNKLPKGQYVLYIRKAAGFGDKAYDYASLSFEILPRFYESKLFYLACFALLLGLIYLVYKLRYRWIIRMNTRLENEVRAHVIEHKKLIQQLQLSVVDLKLSKDNLIKANNEKEKIISVLIHDLISPLKFLNKLAGRLYQHFDHMEVADQKKIAGEINASTAEIFSFSDNFLKWLNPARAAFNRSVETFDMKDIVAELAAIYEDIHIIRHNVFQLTAEAASVVTTDRSFIKTIGRNLIYFANTNCAGNTISLSFDKIKNTNRFTLTFNGSKKIQDKINYLYALDNNLADLEVSDYGFYINFAVIKDLLARINGSFENRFTDGNIIIEVVFPDLLKNDADSGAHLQG